MKTHRIKVAWCIKRCWFKIERKLSNFRLNLNVDLPQYFRIYTVIHLDYVYFFNFSNVDCWTWTGFSLFFYAFFFNQVLHSHVFSALLTWPYQKNYLYSMYLTASVYYPILPLILSFVILSLLVKPVFLVFQLCYQYFPYWCSILHKS